MDRKRAQGKTSKESDSASATSERETLIYNTIYRGGFLECFSSLYMARNKSAM